MLSLTLDRDSGEILGAEPGGEVGEVALNPLDPCGACMEWLKKVGEVNPEFKIVNFADTSCDQVYIRTVGDYG